jgi:cytochrome b561
MGAIGMAILVYTLVLVAGQYLLHNGIEAAWKARLDGSIPNEPFPNPHAIVGMAILVLTLWRIVLRLRRGAPSLPSSEPKALKAIAGATHLAFYAILLAMPVSGALAWVAGLEMPAEAHEIAAKVLLALIALHIIGAVAQKFWFKSDVMARMSPKRMMVRPS